MTLPSGSTPLTHASTRGQHMTEDDLLTGIIDALNVGGWLWTHTRRSDLGQTMGMPGVPDIIAVHPTRRTQIVALELKSAKGRMRPGQLEWLTAMRDNGADARVVTPDSYDETWRWLVGDRLIERRRV